MSDQISNRGLRKLILRAWSMTVQFVSVGLREIFVDMKEMWSLFKSVFARGRRNRDFERAGRESRNVVRRHASVAVFRKGERERAREVMQAEHESRSLLSSNSKQAVEYREELTKRKADYSRGATVNHLAMVNAKQRKAMSSDEQGESKPEALGKKLPK